MPAATVGHDGQQKKAPENRILRGFNNCSDESVRNGPKPFHVRHWVAREQKSGQSMTIINKNGQLLHKNGHLLHDDICSRRPFGALLNVKC
ncbi:MAG TPA: hypothetical protein PLF65_12940, partial [Desulfobacter postgatei]|nr:hypothetical protein [Desulfobacter postgatei]